MNKILNIILASFLLADANVAMYRQVNGASGSEHEVLEKAEECSASLQEIDVECVTQAMDDLEIALGKWIQKKQLRTPDEALAFLFTMHPFIAITHISIAFSVQKSIDKILYGSSGHSEAIGIGYGDCNYCRNGPLSRGLHCYDQLAPCQTSVEQEALKAVVDVTGFPGRNARCNAWEVLWETIWCRVDQHLAKHSRKTTNINGVKAKMSHKEARQFYAGKYCAARRMKLECAVYREFGPQFVSWIDTAYEHAKAGLALSKVDYPSMKIDNPCLSWEKWHSFCKRFAQLSPNASLYLTAPPRLIEHSFACLLPQYSARSSR